MDEIIAVSREDPTEGSSAEWSAEERQRSSESRGGCGGGRAEALLDPLEHRGRGVPERIDESLPGVEEDGELLHEVFSFLKRHGISVYGSEEEAEE